MPTWALGTRGDEAPFWAGSTRTLGVLCVVAAAGLAALVGFHRPGHAQPSYSVEAPIDVAPHAVWEPTVVNAPGLPVQCSDGAWTRTMVRGGCARHGGVTY